ncbi:hypothetical protein Rleg9DRAFT_3679 [Rhizobium leguminosarum bv. trifolii WSM597]|uniref:Uncharacterized protein n=1 Tax=Rhizobium leguminosarum bv. trifolii WSM597 TaxID=754764 RepID=J0H473_RHILT|nr:hypothetical protein [Rhizobium leguminosarum]EJB04820.1 hypothetical protein Rleg9DRAFT_3679 [Rhizobium leguminosarum bv. trifolii WSM597]
MKHTFPPTWTSLGAIGRSPVSKLSILMPFIGYLILLQDKVIGLMGPFASTGVALEPKLSIGFYLLYFGLFIFGSASFLFHIACPVIMKRFYSAEEYVERMQTLITASELKAKLVLIIDEAGAESETGKEASLYHSSISAGMTTQAQPAVRNFTLRAYFDNVEKSHASIRLAVFILFSAGIFLTTIPSLIALIRVLSDFVKIYIF